MGNFSILSSFSTYDWYLINSLHPIEHYEIGEDKKKHVSKHM